MRIYPHKSELMRINTHQSQIVRRIAKNVSSLLIYFLVKESFNVNFNRQL
jgi:hypothetical protein